MGSKDQRVIDSYQKFNRRYCYKTAHFTSKSIMKIELCPYSGYKIYPGRGRTLIKQDGKTYKFLDARSHKAHLLKRNPRKVTWTVLYRRKHRKGIEEEVSKKRTKRTQKFQRAVVGATLQDILAKRNQKPDVRKAQREQAIRAAKEVKKTTKASKKPAPAAKPKPSKAQKVTKNVQKSAPKVGGKR